jgi:hypothetical protein
MFVLVSNDIFILRLCRGDAKRESKAEEKFSVLSCRQEMKAKLRK